MATTPMEEIFVWVRSAIEPEEPPSELANAGVTFPLPSVASKKIPLLVGVSHPTLDWDTPEKKLDTCFVPAAVPSDVQSAPPPPAAPPRKNNRCPTTVRV